MARKRTDKASHSKFEKDVASLGNATLFFEIVLYIYLVVNLVLQNYNVYGQVTHHILLCITSLCRPSITAYAQLHRHRYRVLRYRVQQLS